ncbi:MAG: hypothetical protein ACRCWM_07565 [Sarcina sp.]
MKRQVAINKVIELKYLIRITECETKRNKYITELDEITTQLSKTETAYYDLGEGYSSVNRVVSNEDARRKLENDYYGDYDLDSNYNDEY